ncbi:MAG TPA: hypothetical protein PLF35_12790 [Prolixibacteraceae bacterium]|nr:hypothetical protein [Prolixibacteraceae bacterium]
MKLNSKHILFVISMGIFMYLMVIAVLSPLRFRNQLHQKALSDSLFMLSINPSFSNPVVKPLVKIEAYKQSLLQLSRFDSIGLSVNLADSSIMLKLKGLVLYDSDVVDFKVDPVLKGLRIAAYLNSFSRPLESVASYSSFQKEPIVVKKAPATPEEALAIATLPDSIPLVPAYFWIELNSGLKLFIVQDDWKSSMERKVKRKYKRDLHRLRIENVFKSALNPSEYHYSPTIIIEINADAAITIFRALPVFTKVSLIF